MNTSSKQCRAEATSHKKNSGSSFEILFHVVIYISQKQWHNRFGKRVYMYLQGFVPHTWLARVTMHGATKTGILVFARIYSTHLVGIVTTHGTTTKTGVFARIYSTHLVAKVTCMMEQKLVYIYLQGFSPHPWWTKVIMHDVTPQSNIFVSTTWSRW